MQFLILFVVLMLVSVSASYSVLYGVSAWWQLSNGDLTEEQALKARRRAVRLVSIGFTMWSGAIIFIVNVMQMGLLFDVLRAVGIDTSSVR